MGGLLEFQDSSVQNRLDEIMSKDNDLMRAAGTRGKQAAASRGLLNTSMGVQAGEAAMLDVALPIASQEAGQAQEINLQLQDIFSREQLQLADQAFRKEALGLELDSRERIAMAEIDSAMERLSQELGSREQIAALDRDAQQRIQEMEINLRDNLAGRELSAKEREAAAGMAVEVERVYSQMVSTVMNNPEIPASARQEYMNHASTVRDSNYGLIQQMYNIDLDWDAPTGGSTPNYQIPASVNV